MNNYQLCRTNPRMSGQIKWDLILSSSDSELYISDFDLSPISKHIYQSKHIDNILNYDHLYNLKRYYANFSNGFYKTFEDPSISSPNIMMTNNDYNQYKHKWIDLHDDTLEFGISRSRYKITGRQFEFFCPVWLENFGINDELVFEFSISTGDSLNKVISKSLSLTPNKHKIHDKVVDYFNKYVENIIDNNSKIIGDNLINIDLDNFRAEIRGVDVKNGKYNSSVNITGLSQDILKNERLLIENDEMIINSFRFNELIAPQLFNFNFIFNYEDLATHVISKYMYGSEINISLNVKIIHSLNDSDQSWVEYLQTKDLYTNYDALPCILDGQENDDLSVFDLIMDPQNIKYTLQNKISPTIIHWSLADNNDYIFNMYSGFGGCKTIKEFDRIEVYSTADEKVNNIFSQDGALAETKRIEEYLNSQNYSDNKNEKFYIMPLKNSLGNISYNDIDWNTVLQNKEKDSESHQDGLSNILSNNTNKQE